MNQSICDKFALAILTELFDNPSGLRFTDIKRRLPVTDPVISHRLALLKKHELVKVSPVIDEENDEKYFVYRITNEGSQFAELINIKNLMETVNKIDKRKGIAA